MNVKRFYHTVKHLKPTQIIHQVLNRGKRFIPKFVWSLALPSESPRCITRLSRPFEKSDRGVKFVSPSKLVLLNRPHDLALNSSSQGALERWFPQHLSHLELFHLHYFDYIHSVNEVATGINLTERWIDEVPEFHPIGWHPYPTSRRICNWIFYYSRHRKELSEEASECILKSLYGQLHYLKWNLEYHLLGNHLFENLKALIIGSLFFEETSQAEKYLDHLERELETQILACGGHYERSPGYHLLVLEGLVELAGALQSFSLPLPDWLKHSLEKMSFFAEAIFGKGHYPAFNDSSKECSLSWPDLKKAILEYRLIPEESLFIPKEEKIQYLQGSGLIVFNGNELILYFDAGSIGPDHLPGHAHNDTLSFLLYSKETPVLTDSGVYEYTEGYWRTYFRSAKAHNVITIDGEEPNDIWKSFRVGYRGYPFDIEAGERVFAASDSAYERLGVRWRRSLRINEDEDLVTVTDSLENLHQERTIEWYFHFAPGYTVEGLEGAVTLKNDRVKVMVTAKGRTFQEERSWYSFRFGEKVERTMLTGKARLPLGKHLFETSFQIIRNEPAPQLEESSP